MLSKDDQIIFPQQIKYEAEYPNMKGSKRMFMRNQPSNASTFQGGETIKVLCSGVGNDNLLLDTSTVRKNFKATFTCSAGDTEGTDFSYLLGSGYSYINSYRSIANGGVNLDEINSFNTTMNMLVNTTFTRSDLHSVGQQIGKDATFYNSNIGHAINKGAFFQKTFNYSLPLPGMLGLGTDQYIPLRNFTSLECQFVVENFSNFIVNATNKVVLTCVISDVELTYDVVEMGHEAKSLFYQTYPSLINIRTRSFVVSVGNLTAQSAGNQDIIIGHRKRSLKNLIAICNPANSIEKRFGSINPNLGPTSGFVVNSVTYPNMGLDVSNKPEMARYELMKAVGNSNVGNLLKSSFYRSSADSGLFKAYATTAITDDATAIGASSQFYFGCDLETLPHNNGMMNGRNVDGANPTFRASITTALANTNHTLYFVSEYDAVISIDQINKIITVSD